MRTKPSIEDEIFAELISEERPLPPIQPGRYAIYAILDPSRSDPHDVYNGTPIYVGQTQDLTERGAQHLWYGKHRSQSRVSKAIANMLEDRIFPTFVAIDAADSRLEALVKETLWAQRMHIAGYLLCNMATDQSRLLTLREMRRACQRKVWELTVAEASQSPVRLLFRCRGCGYVHNVNLRGFANDVTGRSKLLAKFKTMRPQCPSCGRTMCARAPVPRDYLRQFYTIIDLYDRVGFGHRSIDVGDDLF